LSSTPAQAAAWAPKLEEGGVPCFEVPSRAVAAAAMLCDFAQREKQSALATPVRVVAAQKLSLDNTRSGLDEDESKRCIEAYGIRTPRRLFVDASEPYPERIDLQFPVAVKIVSPDIIHKTEAGGVRLRVTAADLRRTLDEIRASASSYMPNARIRGFLLEEMAEGVEMIVGALSNPSFGPLVVVGMGGVHAEVLRDVARRYAPISAAQAREMIAELKGGRLLEAYRGQRPRDVTALADAIARLSWMITDHEGPVSEIEINPLLVGFDGSGVSAVDAVVRLR
jgi:acetyltransferase